VLIKLATITSIFKLAMAVTHQVTFYPVGNGDTSQINLANGKRLLFDFRHQQQGENKDHPVIDLKAQLRKELGDAKKDFFDVVAFTHSDKDHIAASTEFFELRHALKYQGDDRIKINELWVPAAMILETATNDQQSDEFVIWRQEARYRLKEGKGIQVFSKPEMLKKWLADNDLTVESRKHLITDAGTLAKGFNLQDDGVEFFCHSPFVKHVDGSEDIQRNEASLIFQVRFEVQGVQSNYLAVGDSTYEVLEDIVNITEYHGRGDRLDWNLFSIPHHCSYKALGPDKGEKETEPTDSVKTLLSHGQYASYLVSSSNPILDIKDAYDQALPPHIQSQKTYKKYLKQVEGRSFFVTMSEPNANKPKPITFEVTSGGLTWKESFSTGAAGIISSTPPRAG
jgi:hypothetical protein